MRSHTSIVCVLSRAYKDSVYYASTLCLNTSYRAQGTLWSSVQGPCPEQQRAVRHKGTHETHQQEARREQGGRGDEILVASLHNRIRRLLRTERPIRPRHRTVSFSSGAANLFGLGSVSAYVCTRTTICLLLAIAIVLASARKAEGVCLLF